MQGEKTVLVPEDIGRQAAYMLLEEVQRGGICDSMHQVWDLCILACRALTAIRLITDRQSYEGHAVIDHAATKMQGSAAAYFQACRLVMTCI